MRKHLGRRIARHQPSVNLDLAAVGYDVDSGPAPDGSNVPGGVAKDRVGAGGQMGFKAPSQRRQRPGHILDRVVALLGHRAVGRDAVRADAPADGALLRGDDAQLGWLADHRRVDRRASFGHHPRTDHHDLFADGPGKADIHRKVRVVRRGLQHVQHGRHAALGIG